MGGTYTTHRGIAARDNSPATDASAPAIVVVPRERSQRAPRTRASVRFDLDDPSSRNVCNVNFRSTEIQLLTISLVLMFVCSHRSFRKLFCHFGTFLSPHTFHKYFDWNMIASTVALQVTPNKASRSVPIRAHTGSESNCFPSTRVTRLHHSAGQIFDDHLQCRQLGPTPERAAACSGSCSVCFVGHGSRTSRSFSRFWGQALSWTCSLDRSVVAWLVSQAPHCHRRCWCCCGCVWKARVLLLRLLPSMARLNSWRSLASESSESSLEVPRLVVSLLQSSLEDPSSPLTGIAIFAFPARRSRAETDSPSIRE